MAPLRLIIASLGVSTLLSLVQAAPQFGPQATGVITGSAPAEARSPYTDYIVRVRDAEGGQPLGTGLVGEYSSFSVDRLPVGRPMLLELLNVKDGRLLCVQGIYRLSAAAPIRTDVVIECGKKPAARWLLPASAGLPAFRTGAIHSVSR